jgi:beta-lactamase superfamily II metal-dependent hydrolase
MMHGGHGDALVIEYGSASNARRLLVDAGTVHSYDNVRAHLLKRNDNRYECFVITHVDEDHIGGAIPLLRDPDLRHRIRHVWFNGYVHSERGGNVLGPIDGERLTKTINDGDFTWNAPFKNRISPAVGGPIVVPSTGDLPSLTLDGNATLYFLSPTGPKLKRMATEWKKVVTAAHLVPGAGTDRDSRAPKSHEKKVKALPETLSAAKLKALAAKSTVDNSAANGSSIAFIIEHGGKRALLGADAHPTVLLAGLKRFAKMKGETRVKLDLCKLPHHCSRANVTTALIEAIDAARYMVSTDGMTFGHPDDAALARILCSSARPAEIYCNYASARTVPWQKRAAAAGARLFLPAAGKTSMRVEAR